VGIDLVKGPALPHAVYNDSQGVAVDFNRNMMRRANRELGANVDPDAHWRCFMNMFDLSGRVAVVTGASKGMGFAIARALGLAGATVIVSARTLRAATEAAGLLQAEGIEARGLILDVTDQGGASEFSANALAAFGRIDVLVLNAAANTPTGSLLSQEPDELSKVMHDNLQANFTIVNAIVPQMLGRKDGSLIFMSSRAAKRGSSTLGMYAMAKAAIDQYVRNLALELGPANINVNSINPGPVRTGFSKVLWEDPNREAAIVAATPMRRIGEPSDVAGLALLLASAAGHFIHGQNISVDGGMTA
jgi:NAD(P)-dependent dehydrogenase (short-subunit alcohol dehydrogenase family)